MTSIEREVSRLTWATTPAFPTSCRIALRDMRKYDDTWTDAFSKWNIAAAFQEDDGVVRLLDELYKRGNFICNKK